MNSNWAMFFESASRWGLGLVLAILIFWLFAWIVRFVMKLTCSTLDKHASAIELLSNRIQEHEVASGEARKYTRSEHERMASILNEITNTLGRINGFKHQDMDK